MEVGPLARALVMYASGNEQMKELVDYTLKTLDAPVEALFSLLAGAGLVRAVKVPEDIDAREAMSLASLYGGITLANAGLGLAHGLAHPLGIRYGIPHGMACALTMAKVIQYNRPARRQRYDEIAGLLGGGADAADAFSSLLERLGVPARLSDYGVKKSDIPRIVEESRGGSRGYNPIDHNDETVARMLEELL